MFKDISKEEWKFLGIVWIISAAIVFLPMIIGYFLTPSDSVFLFRRNAAGQDYAAYFSEIEQAKHGIFFFKDYFTQEPQKIGVLNPFWSLVGLLAIIFSLSDFIAFHLASFLLIPIFLLSAYCLISYFFEEKNKRKICFIFFVFTSGLGGYISIIDPKIFLIPNLHIPSINIGEAFTPNILSSPPHYIASLTLLILIFLFSLYFFEKNKFIYSFLSGLCALFLFSFHPFHIYTIFSVLFIFLIVEFLIDQKIYLNHIIHYVILLIFSAPPVIYYLWCFLNIPVYYQTYFLQNITLTPALWIVLTDYGVFLILAILGVASFLKNKSISKRNIFLIVWAITQFFLIYSPIKTQRRLFEGLYIPIIILAVYGLFFLRNYIKNNWKSFYQLYNIFSVGLFIYVFCFSSFLVFMMNLSFVQSSGDYLSKYDENAMLWIRKNTPEQSIILSSYANGNIIPVFAFRPVYCGHWAETFKVSEKMKMLDDFFGKDNEQERKDFLEANKINYLFWGPEEKKTANNLDPDKETFLEKVYSNNMTTVYKIN